MEGTSNGTADAWRERIAAQQASGQSIRAWCRQHSHHEHAFYWWRSRLGLSPKSVPAKQQRSQSRAIQFAEVLVDRVASDSIRLRLGGGRELLMPVSMPVELVAQLVRAIEGAA